MTLTAISDRIRTAKGERTFYAVKNGTPRIEETNLFSLAIQRVPFLLGVEMRTERQKELQRMCMKRYYKKNPWAIHHNRAVSRCVSKASKYYKRGIKSKISIADIKHLWFRDKAYLMKKPSLHRINNKKYYSLKNCRFIEFEEQNVKPVLQFDMNGVFIAKYPSIKEAAKKTGIRAEYIAGHLRCLERGFLWKEAILSEMGVGE